MARTAVEGQSGFDTHIFNGAGGNEIFAATASGGRVTFTRNTGGIVMDLNGIEALDVRALGGTDSVTINDLTGTDLQERRRSTAPPPSVAPTATTRPTR